jgi:hypothetical protein
MPLTWHIFLFVSLSSSHLKLSRSSELPCTSARRPWPKWRPSNNLRIVKLLSIFVKGLIKSIKIDQRIYAFLLQVLIEKSYADIRGQCVDGVEFDNLVDVVSNPIAQMPRKRRHHDRNCLRGIKINPKPFNF